MSEVDEILDHPCKQTCSGWRQGHEKGRVQGREEVLSLLRSDECLKAEWEFGWGHELSHMKLADWLEAKLREGEGK